MLSHNDREFLALAKIAATGSTCIYQSVGAVLAKGDRWLSSGCNHVPEGLESCHRRGYCRTQGTDCGNSGLPSRALHAEATAILQSPECQGATLYCTHQPCLNCLKVMAGAGVARVVYVGQPITDSIRHEFHSVLAIEAVPVGEP